MSLLSHLVRIRSSLTWVFLPPVSGSGGQPESSTFQTGVSCVRPGEVSCSRPSGARSIRPAHQRECPHGVRHGGRAGGSGLCEQENVSSAQGTTVQQKTSVPVKQEEEEEEDDDMDLFGSDDDEEADKLKEQRLKEYAEKKAKKPGVIAKSSILLDVKPVSSRALWIPAPEDVLLTPPLSCSGTTRRTW